MNSDNQDTTDSGDLLPWEPHGLIRSVTKHDADLSRGFLRSRPERWVPSLSLQWMPLFHSLGIDIRVVEVKPVSVPPNIATPSIMLALGDKYLVLVADKLSKSRFTEALSPDCDSKAGEVFLEYLGRRLLGSLAISWGDQEQEKIRIFSGIDSSSNDYGGAIKISIVINGKQVVLWLMLSPSLVDMLDNLWRKQLHSTFKNNSTKDGLGSLFTGEDLVSIEIAQLAVPPAVLPEYTKSGQAVDLDVLITDTVVLRLNENVWVGARICDVEGNLGCEILPTVPSSTTFPDGFARLSVVFGSIQCDTSLLAELSQPGSIYDTGIQLGDSVGLMVNGEKVGSGILRCYKGRFALEVE